MEKPNFHEISEERKSVRKALKEAREDGLPESITNTARAEEERLDKEAAEFSIEKEGGLSKAKARLKTESIKAESPLDLEAIRQELGPTFTELEELEDQRDSLRDFEMRRILDSRENLRSSQFAEKLLKTIHNEKTDLETRLQTLESQNPSLAHAAELVRNKEALAREGHITLTPTTEKYLDEIGKKMLTGKPMFLHGPTGTGKTSLARYAAEHFTGKAAEMVYCNPQTRESAVWGKTGIRPTKEGAIETVDIFGPLAKAMRDGKAVIFDEFTALPREQQVFIKGIFNAKPEDEVNVVGNGKVKIAPGFQMIFTANLKSEKNPERQELPPEIAREFEQNNLKINYHPKNESYDIMLSRLMNPDGSVSLSWHDLNVTLPKFCEAMNEVQVAYTGATDKETAKLLGVQDVAGKTPGLKKLVFTQGTVENILDGWKLEKQTATKPPSFSEYLDSRLKTALTFEEYSPTDRLLAAKILASKGLLRTTTPEELNLPKDVFNFDAGKKLRGDAEAVKKLKAESGKEVRVPLKELADLDPWNTRKKKTGAEVFLQKDAHKAGRQAEVLELTDEELEEVTTQNDKFFKDTYKIWNSSLDTSKVKFKPELKNPKDLDLGKLKDDTAQNKFGEYTLNPESQTVDFENLPESKIFIPDLSTFVGKKVHEVMKHIQDTYGDSHTVPGLEYYKWLIENPDKTPDKLKDGNYYFFPGSLFRDSSGGWHVPDAFWDGSEWKRDGVWLDGGWGGRCRVVLVEK